MLTPEHIGTQFNQRVDFNFGFCLFGTAIKEAPAFLFESQVSVILLPHPRTPAVRRASSLQTQLNNGEEALCTDSLGDIAL